MKEMQKPHWTEDRDQVTLFTSFSSCNDAIKISGIIRYAHSLYNELKKQKQRVIYTETAAVNCLFLATRKIIGKDLATVASTNPLFFPPQKKRGIIHCTSQTLALPLLYTRRKCIVTVHDLIPIATRTYNSLTEKIIWFFLIMALKKATHIIADSDHTKKDIIKYVKYPEERITVIPLGIDQNEFYERKIKREEATILFVGSEHKRKNVELIIKALPYVADEIQNITFIKVGQAQDNENKERLRILAKELSVEKRIIWKEYVQDLAEEYSKATIFVFPSLYEGFGFPVLEAMACGCPVITTDKTSLPEVARGAAIYCDGYDEKNLAKKIILLLKDKKKQRELRAKGYLQAKKFTWEKCAQKTIKVYNQFCKVL